MGAFIRSPLAVILFFYDRPRHLWLNHFSSDAFGLFEAKRRFPVDVPENAVSYSKSSWFL
jgi:hypothetical protein